MLKLLLVSGVFLTGAASAGWAQAPSVPPPDTFFGRRIEIVGTTEEERLLVDGREVHRAPVLSLDDVEMVGRTPVVIGSSSSGGNGCAGSSFVISFAVGATPRFDGPVGDCDAIDHRVHGDAIEFTTTALPSRPGRRWVWTASRGFATAGATLFQTDASKGWDELRGRRIGGPWDVFAIKEIADQAAGLLGADTKRFTSRLTGVASGRVVGDFYLGSGCLPHRCGSEEAMIAADLQNRRIYLAWKTESAPVEVRPPIAGWPAPARVFLRDWAKPWN
jgi:hypothetical protein